MGKKYWVVEAFMDSEWRPISCERTKRRAIDTFDNRVLLKYRDAVKAKLARCIPVYTEKPDN